MVINFIKVIFAFNNRYFDIFQSSFSFSFWWYLVF